jgi:hypothetical protein
MAKKPVGNPNKKKYMTTGEAGSIGGKIGGHAGGITLLVLRGSGHFSALGKKGMSACIAKYGPDFHKMIRAGVKPSKKS